MKIRRYKGITREDLGIDIPADKELSNLSEEMKKKINQWGEFKEIAIYDIEPNTQIDRETIEKIASDGFYLWKATVKSKRND